jgi:hypothetical protein
MYGYLADALVFIHLLYCAYVVLGQVAIIIAAPFRWQWARNPWFRYTHLLAIAVVVLEVGMGWRCPLTVWEEQLRTLAGQDPYSGNSFLGRMAHDMLFLPNLPEIFFNTLHVAMGVVVVQGLIMFPPRWFRPLRESTNVRPQAA